MPQKNESAKRYKILIKHLKDNYSLKLFHRKRTKKIAVCNRYLLWVYNIFSYQILRRALIFLANFDFLNKTVQVCVCAKLGNLNLFFIDQGNFGFDCIMKGYWHKYYKWIIHFFLTKWIHLMRLHRYQLANFTPIKIILVYQ